MPLAYRGSAPLRRPVRELIRHAPVTCSPTTTIAEAARLMQAEAVGAVVVVDGDGSPIGIVTDRDLRGKVVAAELPPSEPVGRIMSAPLHVVSAEAPAVEALLEMLRRGIRHLPVLEAPAADAEPAGDGRGRLVGVVSSHDFLTPGEAHPVPLLRAIERQTRVDDLAAIAPKVTVVIRALLDDGVPSADIARITAELHDALVRRLLAIAEQALAADGFGHPPVRYCWLALGSEGRREQTLATDQDNALVHERPPADVPAWAVDRYFERLAAETVSGLVRCGVPRCPADVMASNRTWRQPVDVWERRFSRWIRQSSPEDLLEASIVFDFRPVFGAHDLADRLFAHLREEVESWKAFLRLMAWSAVSTAPPIGLFGRLVTPLWGPSRGRINLKLQGMLPLVNALRVHALELGLRQTNTLERLEAAAARDGRFPPQKVEELTAAYEVITRLRIRRQLADLDAGRPPTSAVEPRALNRAERAGLREALLAVRSLQNDLRTRFLTDMLFG
ncbi:MAG TPA: DUF294 nucleotidyltransferase-like domain-containing protein [Thermodesulfobacteriota bacterium]